MEDVLIPLGIFVVLPVMIVWLVCREKQNRTNRMTEVMLKAIESGTAVDTEFFRNSTEKKSVKEKMLNRLTGACVTTLLGVIISCLYFVTASSTDNGKIEVILYIGGLFLAVGIALFIVYFVGRKMLRKEIEAEEKQLTGEE